MKDIKDLEAVSKFHSELTRRHKFHRLRIYQFNGSTPVGPNSIWNEQNVKLLRSWSSYICTFSNQNSVHTLFHKNENQFHSTHHSSQ